MPETAASIKSRRTVKRGRLTTLRKQFEEISLQDLRDLDLTVLTTLQKSIKRDTSHHQELQTKFENLVCPEDEANEDKQTAFSHEVTSGEEHQQTYEQLIDEVDLLVMDYNLHREAERLFSAHSSWAEVADPKAKTFISESKECVAEIKDFLKRSEHRASSETINYGREKLSRDIIKETHKLVHSIKDEPDAATPAPREIEHRTKFDIELPHFHGNPMEWSQFYSLFSTTIEKRGKHLSSEERCCLLLKSLKDQHARDLAQLNTAGENGFEDAIAALKQRYGQAQIILPQHIANIKSQQTFRFNRDSLLHMGKHHQTTYRSLKKLKVDLSSFMAAYAASQFDEKLSEEWSKFTITLSGLPTMEDLDTYTQSLVCRLPSASNNVSSHSRSTDRAPQQTAANSKPKPKPAICSLCNESVHSLSKCPIFKEYTPERRGKFVKDKRWCMNCLHPSHVSHNCPSTYTCRHCNGKHHTLLHRGETTSTSPANTTGAQSTATCVSTIQPRQTKHSDTQQNELKPPTHAFLNTALVKAINGGRNKTSRIALDSGSSTSLITEALASHLKLKRYPQHLALEGAYSEGTSKAYVQTTLQSLHDPKQQVILKLSVVSKLPYATPPSRIDDIASDENVKDLQLADNYFGGRLDILLGSLDVCKCMQGKFKYFPLPDIAISPTIFGWTVTGPLDLGQSSKFLSIKTTKDDLLVSLQRLWEIDQVPSATHYTQAEESALKQFADDHSVTSSGRYSVALPRVDQPPVIGSSRNTAISRFLQNERSLSKKGKLTEFNCSLQEYLTLDHAEKVPQSELNNRPSYYLPVHGVFKETSTTTKVRPVFDASARTDNGISLNDLLLAGPNLYPLLTDILIQFRTHRIGFSADISKMFREILIQPSERDLHRFIMRDQDGNINDFRMKRLTFGIKSSPFLATKVIQHLAERRSLTHPIASEAILTHFYVDDYLSGASTLEEAIQIREQICELLSLAGMTLRKWRTSSPEFASSIPESLLETETLTLNKSPKALGIHWDTSNDVFNVAIPNISSHRVTKRTIASEAAKVYDILGLFSPFVIRSKMILQSLWKIGCEWDQEAPSDLQQLWKEWVDELPLIHRHSVNRRYSTSNSPVIYQSLHGFSDASSAAYGAIVYLRTQHEDGSIVLSIVIAKARVAPLKALTIPRAELTAAHLLTQLLIYSAKLLDIQQTDIHAWTDSTIVLCWLRKTPSSLQTFVANRVANIQSNLPNSPWKHVPTKENPADLLSRGVSASILTESSLWWEGPKWLSQPPAQWSSQQSVLSSLPKILPEQRAVTLTAVVKHNNDEQDFKLWSKFSSFYLLTRVLAWVKRFISNARSSTEQRNLSSTLLPTEIQSSKIFLFKQSQSQSFENTLSALNKGKTVPQNSPLARLNVALNNGLIMVSGRVRQINSKQPKQVIALSAKSQLTQLFLSSQHNSHHHPGVSSLLAIITENFYIPGLKNTLKLLSRSCAICQKAYSRTIQPPMGLLPSERTTPTPPFQVTGLDFAGPFTIKKGHTRRPVLIKAYACLFVCFSTKATHLELCSDLSKEAFLAAFRRFCARRGTPTSVHSDNGTNFVGAASEIQQLQHLINTAQDDLSHLASTADIAWHFIPPRSPNFGGLWEAGVRRMKVLLKKQISPHPLTFEELNTILTEVESTLNSRPITPLDSTELSEDLVLTPGHFIIGRPLRAPPRPSASDANISSLKRWSLVQRLQQDLWHSWRAWYVQTLLQRTKWHRSSRQINVGDLVLLKDESLTSGSSWPMARIVKLFHGDDGIARTADIVCHGKTYRRAISRFVPLFPSTTQST